MLHKLHFQGSDRVVLKNANKKTTYRDSQVVDIILFWLPRKDLNLDKLIQSQPSCH